MFFYFSKAVEKGDVARVKTILEQGRDSFSDKNVEDMIEKYDEEVILELFKSRLVVAPTREKFIKKIIDKNISPSSST